MTNLTESLNANKTQPPQNHKNPTPDEIAIIPEMQIIPETQSQESSGLQFSLPSMVTKNRYNILQSTPETIDSSTPNINSCKQTTPTPQNQQHQLAKIFAIRLHKMSFVDTGCFINTTTAIQMMKISFEIIRHHCLVLTTTRNLHTTIYVSICLNKNESLAQRNLTII